MPDKITKVEPLKCPMCGGTRVSKNSTTIKCVDCGKKLMIKTGKIKDYRGHRFYGRGGNPRWDDDFYVN